MARKSLTFIVVLAGSITVSSILITAQQRGGQPNAASVKPLQTKGDNQQNQPAIPYEQYERDIKAISDQLKAIQTEIAKANSQRANSENKWSWWFGSGPPIWSNWILAVIAFGAGWVALNAFNHERDAVRLTQRADVLVEGVNVSTGHRQPVTGDSCISIQWRNYGPTRANEVRLSASLLFAELQVPYESVDTPIIALASGDRQPQAFIPLRKCMTNATFKDILDGKTELRFVAKAEYRDVFGSLHHTHNEGIYRREDGTFQITKCDSD